MGLVKEKQSRNGKETKMQRSSSPAPAWRVVGFAVIAFAAAVTLLLPGPLWANGSDSLRYRMELVVKSGDRAGGVQTLPDNHLGIGSLNDNGQLVFTIANAAGTFRWDAKAQQVIPVALNGSPAPHGLTFVQAGGPHPVINNRGDIAMVGMVKDAAGYPRSGVFYVASNGSMTPVAAPGQTLPDGRKIAAA